MSSFVLLASSLTMVLAHNAALARDYARMRLWLVATAMLGLTFVGGQVFEFTSFFREGLTLHTNLFGSTFFVLTGFHGVHVTVGILMLLIARRVLVPRLAVGRPGVPGRDGRAVLALRRHRVDRDLHGRLPDPGSGRRMDSDGGGRMTSLDPRTAPEAHEPEQHTAYHPSAREYIRVGLLLIALTCIEVC